MTRKSVLDFLLLVLGSAIVGAAPARAQNAAAAPSAPPSAAPIAPPSPAPIAPPSPPPTPSPPPEPISKIKPGEVNVPIGKGEQRLMLGELVALDPKARTGSFRLEGNDKIETFRVLPYAELGHHGASGDLEDFRVGERCLVRLHKDEEGKWTWLTYLGDEMDFLKNHLSYYWVDALDPATGQITVSRGNAAKTEWGEKGVALMTDAETRFWKDGKPAAFADIHVGDKLRTRMHGVGHGKIWICWDVFLDDESFKKFQEEQRAVHARRMETDGLPAYVDSRDGKSLALTLFQQGREVFKTMSAGQKVRVAVAGPDRKATGEPITGTVTEVKPVRKICKLAVTLDAVPSGVSPPDLVRVWVEK